MPDRAMNVKALLLMLERSWPLPRIREVIVRKVAMIIALTVVARVESILAMPILPKIATRAAKVAEAKA